MTVVTIDASAAASWLLPDEASEATDHLYFDAVDSAHVFQAPGLWAWEAGNLLRMALRRGRIDASQAAVAVKKLAGAGVRLDAPPRGQRMAAILDLSTRRSLTFYDASYLEQAIRTRASLASKDAALRRAARSEGVTCLEL